jgi:hypothetical protein
MSGADWVHWIGIPYGYRYGPPFAFRWFWRREPSGLTELSDEERLELTLRKPVAHEKDLAFVKSDWIRLSLRSLRESFAQGYDWATEDGRVACTDFGFRLQEIRRDLPVKLWYGKWDTHVPPNHGVQIAARIGDSAHLRIVDETHASIVVHRLRDILKELVENT